MEARAVEYVKHEEWGKALTLYDKLLEKTLISDQQILQYLLERQDCLHFLGKHQDILKSCTKTFKLLANLQDEKREIRARLQHVRALVNLEQFEKASKAVQRWKDLLMAMPSSTNFPLQLVLSKYKPHVTWLSCLEKMQSPMGKSPEDEGISCIYCYVSFRDKFDLLAHCKTQEHESVIMSDEGRDWLWRAPPRGLKPDFYTMCEDWNETNACHYGVLCVEAHGEEELAEWNQRFQYREMKLLRAKEKELYGKSYTEELLEQWAQSTNLAAVMCEKVDFVREHDPSPPLLVIVTSKSGRHCWNFKMTCATPLKAIALLQDTHRSHFSIEKIELESSKRYHPITNNQEWLSENDDDSSSSSSAAPKRDHHTYVITVTFETSIFGTFRQSVAFDFGQQPVLVKHLCADVVPETEAEKIQEIRNDIIVSIAERWTVSNRVIVPFASTLVPCGITDWEKNLKLAYPIPEVGKNLQLSNAIIAEKKFTKNNYRERMHQLLCVEEIERYNLVAQYNITTNIHISKSYLLSPNSQAASTAKYSSNDELFASISLGKQLSEDTSEGRLILMHCNTIFLTAVKKSVNVYEALIEDKGKDIIYVRLSAETVVDLKLRHDMELEVQIQFQLNRIPYCEWHYAIDKMPNLRILFPETYVEPEIPWSPLRQWSPGFDTRLNVKQKEAVVAITTKLNVQLPPILVIGPFGTGKTFTLAQAMKDLIKNASNKILLCTHSNSAADLYIKDYLDDWVENGMENARPFRIYYQKRWARTVNATVQKYCQKIVNGQFELPTKEDIDNHQIIVVTLSTSVYLPALGIAPGTFTHILLDEAAQALECETITPLALATENTRIVLAGDHMQMGPHVFSKFAKDRNFHASLLERLYDYYPNQYPCKIMLCENYRAHESIIQFTSESFYDQRLVSSSKQPAHSKYFPLTFFTTRGEDVQDKNSTAFYNNSEVYEVVERVQELHKSWPSNWGDFNDQSIGIVTPYADQVYRIRSELKKKRIFVCVERVLNVQGKQFRAIILSTVRTRRTCNDDSNLDYGFLSNSKLLNTAITRAQSLVAVVGDPVALCSLGRCRKVWERFIQTCSDNSSLFGITWSDLKFQLDGIELKKIYTLNPLAPEFVPRPKVVNFTAPGPRMYLPPPPRFFPPPVFPNLLPPPPVPMPVQRPIAPIAAPRPIAPIAAPRPIAATPPRPIAPIAPPVAPKPPSAPIPPVTQSAPVASSAPSVPTTSSAPSVPIAPAPPHLIQFMNNVHFPEAQNLYECILLLPKGMSLADMLETPKYYQEYWYFYLMKHVSPHAAAKFAYLLATATQRNIMFDRPSDSPNWFDTPTNQINFSKPIYMQEEQRSNPLYNRQSGSSGTNQPSTNGMNQPGTSGMNQAATSGMNQAGTTIMNQIGASLMNQVSRPPNGMHRPPPPAGMANMFQPQLQQMQQFPMQSPFQILPHLHGLHQPQVHGLQQTQLHGMLQSHLQNLQQQSQLQNLQQPQLQNPQLQNMQQQQAQQMHSLQQVQQLHNMQQSQLQNLQQSQMQGLQHPQLLNLQPPQQQNMQQHVSRESELERNLRQAALNVRSQGGSWDNWYDVFQAVPDPVFQETGLARLNSMCM